jgi:RNA polymerase sigma-70 factor (sigma-E family)
MPGRGEDDFTQFVVAASGRLFRTVYAVCGDYQLAEDALQAGLASAYASWPRVSRADNPEAYVQRIVLNQLFAWRRRKAARREVPSERMPEVSSSASHEELVVEVDRIWRALQELPLARRAVVVLRYVEDLSVEDTAKALGVRPGTVKSQASAALAQLRRELDPIETALGGGAR